VLIIDDDAHVRELVRTRFENNNFRVLEAPTGELGVAFFGDAVDVIDVVVIDVGLPGIDGFNVLRRIRASSNVPIVMLTASDGESDRVLGLEIGADDYVVKPFLMRELVARVRALLRRAHPPESVDDPDILQFGNVTVDLHAFEVFFDGTAQGLTAGAQDVDAISIVDGTLYFSTVGNTNPTGLTGTADDADIYSWDGTSFARVWDASAAGLPDGADIDGLTMIDTTHFFVSFGNAKTSLPAIGVVQDEDVVEFDGDWSIFFDGTEQGLGASGQLDLDAIDIG
jgi:CheY-like chemotaxis protein